jgi:hypothetical protein
MSTDTGNPGASPVAEDPGDTWHLEMQVFGGPNGVYDSAAPGSYVRAQVGFYLRHPGEGPLGHPRGHLRFYDTEDGKPITQETQGGPVELTACKLPVRVLTPVLDCLRAGWIPGVSQDPAIGCNVLSFSIPLGTRR